MVILQIIPLSQVLYWSYYSTALWNGLFTLLQKGRRKGLDYVNEGTIRHSRNVSPTRVSSTADCFPLHFLSRPQRPNLLQNSRSHLEHAEICITERVCAISPHEIYAFAVLCARPCEEQWEQDAPSLCG